MDAIRLHHLLHTAEARGLPLWLSGGWAIDARMGRITREHGDIDLAFPGERRTDLLALLRDVGGGSITVS
jgi:2''-aminoglycoside nucleotidyltransferase